MKFVELEADNFKSFEHFCVDLDGHGFVKIDGVNNTDEYSESVGSGKSTIADALSYALTGETVKGNSSMSDVKNMYTKGTCRVSVVFEHGGSTYQIVRGEGGLQLIENGKDISKHLKRETQELIMQKFPFFTPTFIGATVIIGQNMPNAFTNNKPSARKAILEELTNSSFMVEDIKNRLSDRKNEWMELLSSFNSDAVVVDTKISNCLNAVDKAKLALSRLRDVSEIKQDLEALTLEVDSLVIVLDTKKRELGEISAERDRVSERVVAMSTELSALQQAHQDEVMKGVESLLAEKSSAESKLAEVKGLYSAKSSEGVKLRRQISELKNAPTHCPTCGQALPNAHKIDTSKQEAELSALESEVSELGKQATQCEEAIYAVSGRISDFKATHQTTPEIEALKSQLSAVKLEGDKLAIKWNSWKSDIDSLESRLRVSQKRELQVRAELGEVDALRAKYEEEIADAQRSEAALRKELEKVSEAQEVRRSKISVLNQVISFANRDFRTILLSSIIKRLDAYAKSYCKKILDTNQIAFQDDGNNISISYRGRDFGVLSGGESQIVKMCITLALKKTLEDLVGFTTNVMFFDEILDNCDKSTAQQLIELVSCLDLSSTFFISHHDDVYLPVDKTWTVTKTDRISVLTV